MANQEHLAILKQGIGPWNEWRKKNRYIKVDLSNTNLTEVDLIHTDLRGADLSKTYIVGGDLSRARLNGANLRWAELSRANFNNANLSGAILNRARLFGTSLLEANLSRANFIKADLSRAYLMGADLSGATFSGADLMLAILRSANIQGACFTRANLSHTDFIGADLSRSSFKGALLFSANLINTNLTQANFSGADLSGSNLSYTNLHKADFTGCRVHAISSWNIYLEETTQVGLIITHQDEPTITVDNLEVAQFIYLLLNNQKIRDIINTITSKVVLILGRFTEERKKVLEALREELHNHHDLTPVVFDFDPSKNQDLTETVSTLAHMSRFIIADLTDPSSIPHEMATIAPHCIRPIKPIILDQPMLINGQVRERHEYALFRDLRRRYDWVLPIYRYHDKSGLIASLKEQIVTPAEQKAQELENRY